MTDTSYTVATAVTDMTGAAIASAAVAIVVAEYAPDIMEMRLILVIV